MNQDIRFLDFPETLMIASSSRAGSSVTFHILGEHATNADCRKLIRVPGEHRPYFTTCEVRSTNSQGDEIVGVPDTLAIANLEKEFLHEIGYPAHSTDNIERFACQVVGRLIFQFPNFPWNVVEQTEEIAEIIRKVCNNNNTKGVYHDTYSKQLLIALHQKYELPIELYDGTEKFDLVGGPQTDAIVEEPPFVVPRPWQFATSEDFEKSILLIKDPSDVWRLDFWKRVLRPEALKLLVLHRRVEETMNGLIDGWNSPFGFFTYKLRQAFELDGYTKGENSWKSNWVNFSITSDMINDIEAGTLSTIAEVVYRQWADAYLAIIAQSDIPRLEVGKRKYADFGQIREDPDLFFQQLCQSLAVDFSPSLATAVSHFSNTRIQATPGTDNNPERWMHSEHTQVIRKEVGKHKPQIEEIRDKLN